MQPGRLIIRWAGCLFGLLWVPAGSWAQDDAVGMAEQENWYSIEVIIFSRALENATLDPQSRYKELLILEKRPRFNAHLKALIPPEGAVHRPQRVEHLTNLINSVYYAPVVQLAPSGSTPELESVTIWLDGLKTRHSPRDNLSRLFSGLDRAHQYWPYIKPLFPGSAGQVSVTPPVPEQNLLIDQPPDGDKTIIPTQLAFKAKPADSLQMLNAATAIREDQSLNLLWHQGWQQPVPPRGKGTPVLIQKAQTYANDVDTDLSLNGALTVELGRFLHSHIQLWARPAGQAGYLYFDSIVRSSRDELHYLDHPYFGILLLIKLYAGAQETGNS